MLAPIKEKIASKATVTEFECLSIHQLDCAGREGRQSPLRHADRRIGRVIDRMRAELEHALSIDDLARQACISPFHFHRLFRAATVETPVRFLTRLRMERAAALLRKSDMSMARVSAACGYGNHAAFTTAFKRWCGETPTRWRISKERLRTS